MYGRNRYGTTRYGSSGEQLIFFFASSIDAQGAASTNPVAIYTSAPTVDTQGAAAASPVRMFTVVSSSDAQGEASVSPVRMTFSVLSIDAQGDAVIIPVRSWFETFTFSDDIADGEIIKIDTDRMTVKLDGADVRANFTGDFWKIISGAQDIVYSDEEESRTLELVVTRKDRKI